MADFRRWIPVLAVLAVVFGVATTASAAPFQCIAAGGVTPLQRSAGITELAGDLVIKCTDGLSTDAGVRVPTVNVQIFLNTQVTSRLIGSVGGTEALLMIDDPTPGNEKVCKVEDNTNLSGGCAGITPDVTGTPQNLPYKGVGADVGPQTTEYNSAGPFNVWQGALAASNSIVFNNVPIDPPGTSGLTRIIRIVNVRDNASAFGVVGSNPASVIALISASPSQSLPITNNAQQVVGFVSNGLVVTPTPSTVFQQCFASPDTFGSDGDGNGLADGGAIKFTEGFSSSFKTRTVNGTGSTTLDQDLPGAIYNTESGFYRTNALVGPAPALAPANAGLADFGTRLKVTMTNLQAGLTVWAPIHIDLVDPGLNLTGGTLDMTSSETGSYSPVGSSASVAGYASFTATATDNSVTWVWEVTAAVTGITETANIQLRTSFPGPPSAPALGTNNFVGWFAPTSSVTVAADSTVPIPRFVDNSTTVTDFAIVKCATHLLFPFVTNQGGFDTGLAISNTSTDQYGTTPQTGTCTLYFYGDSAPAAFTTAADVASGTTWVSTALTLAPGFQGYVIADCEFQYAHGFAFVTKVGAVDLAMGYLALIIPDPPKPRAPSPFDCAGGVACHANSGEQLGY